MSDVEKLVSALRLEIFQQIDEQVRKEVDRERALLRSSILWVSRIFAIVVALVGAVLGFFAVKSYSDLDEIAKRGAEDALRSRIEEIDPFAQYREEQEALHARALLDSFFIQTRREKSYWGPRPPRVTDWERNLLLRIATNSESDLALAADAAEALIATSEDQKVVIQLIDLVEGVTGDTEWIAKDPWRRASIMNKLAEPEDPDQIRKSTPIRSLIMDRESDDKVRSAAISYCAAANDALAIPDLQEAIKEESQRTAAARALARLEPGNAALLALISELTRGQIEASEMATALNLLPELVNRGIGVPTGSPEAWRLAQKILEAAISEGSFRLVSSRSLFRKGRIFLEKRSERGRMYEVRREALLGPSSLAKVAKEAAEQGDLEKLKRIVAFLGYDEEDERAAFLATRLRGDGSFQIATGDLIDEKKAESVRLVVEETDPERLKIQWRDATTDGDRTGTIVEIDHPQALRFEVVEERGYESR